MRLSDYLIGGVILAFTGYFIAKEALSYFPDRIRTVKIADVQRVCLDKSCYWMVYTNSTPMIVSDMWFIFHFNSGDVANKLVQHKGEVCTVETRGTRWHLPTVYPNIVKVIKCQPPRTKEEVRNKP
jgi:hypothetical protein